MSESKKPPESIDKLTPNEQIQSSAKTDYQQQAITILKEALIKNQLVSTNTTIPNNYIELFGEQIATVNSTTPSDNVFNGYAQLLDAYSKQVVVHLQNLEQAQDQLKIGTNNEIQLKKFNESSENLNQLINTFIGNAKKNSKKDVVTSTLSKCLNERYSITNESYLPAEFNTLAETYTDQLTELFYEYSVLNEKLIQDKKLNSVSNNSKDEEQIKKIDDYKNQASKVKNDIQELLDHFLQNTALLYKNYWIQKFIRSKQLNAEEQNKLNNLIKNLTIDNNKPINLSAIINLALNFYQQPRYKINPNNPREVRTDLIQKDIESIQKQQIEQFTKEAEGIFNSLPGKHMIESDKVAREQYVNDFVATQCNYVFHKNKQTLTQLLQQLKEEISSKILEAAKTYQITDESSRQKQEATKRLQQINGYDLLTKEQQQEFINKFIILIQQEKIFSTHKLDSLYTEQEKQLSNEIKKAIQAAFKTTPIVQKYFNDTKNASQFDLIVGNEQLKQLLEQELLQSLATEEANRQLNVQILQKTNSKHISEQIKVAAILCNIKAFNQESIEEQKAQTDQIIKIIQDIETNKKIIYSLKPTNNSTVTTQQQQNIDFSITKIKQLEINIKEIINSITINSTLSDRISKQHIKPDSLMEKFSSMLQKILPGPKIQSALTMAAVAGTAVIATAPLANTIGQNSLSAAIATSPLTAISAAAIGGFIGYKYPVLTRLLFSPIKYLYKEIADIYNNNSRKSFANRAFRSIVILTATAGIIGGIATLVSLAANPFSGSVIAGAAIAGVVGIFTVSAFAKISNIIAKQTSNLIYGTPNSTQYKPTQKAIQAFKNDEKLAIEVGKFFDQKIIDINKLLNYFKGSDDEIAALETCKQNLENTWEFIQQGDLKYRDSWTNTLKQLYLYEEHMSKQNLLNIDNTEIINNLLYLCLPEEHQESVHTKMLTKIQEHAEFFKKHNTEATDAREKTLNKLEEIHLIITNASPIINQLNQHTLTIEPTNNTTTEIQQEAPQRQQTLFNRIMKTKFFSKSNLPQKDVKINHPSTHDQKDVKYDQNTPNAQK